MEMNFPFVTYTTMSNPNIVTSTHINMLLDSKQESKPEYEFEFQLQQMPPIEVFYNPKKQVVLRKRRKKRNIS